MSDNFPADKDWEEAEFRARVLAELPAQLTQGNVDWAIRQLNVSRSTLFRLVKQFREDGRTSALLPDTRGPKPGMQPLDPAVEEIVSRHFKGLYATRRKPTERGSGGRSPPIVGRKGWHRPRSVVWGAGWSNMTRLS
jgi:putative transposase